MALSRTERTELKEAATLLKSISERMVELQDREQAKVESSNKDDYSLPITLGSIAEKAGEAMDEIGDVLTHFANR